MGIIFCTKTTKRICVYVFYNANIRNNFAFSKFFLKKNDIIFKIFENTMVLDKNSCIFVYSHSPSPLSASEYNLEEVI
jgi:hypothetical protein